MTDWLARIQPINVSAAAFGVSAATLGRALQISSGTYHPDALWWLSVSFACCLAGTLTHRLTVDWSAVGLRTCAVILAAGVGWNIAQALSARPGIYLPAGTSLLPFRVGLILMALVTAMGAAGIVVLRRAWFPLVLATCAFLGIWMIRVSPSPAIDVVVVHNEAMNAILAGQDPYRISFPNIYGDAWKAYYSESVVFGDRIAFGYPYPPPSLLLAIPGYLLLGDYRYSELAFLLAAAALIGYSRRHLVARLSAITLLTTPRGFFVLEQGWTDPIAIFVLALTVFQLRRGTVHAGWAAGLMMATKQYLPFTGLAVLRTLWLDRRRWWLAAATIVATGAVCILPFALWHTNSFMRAVVWLQTIEPFRIDALSFLVWADRNGLGRGNFLWAVGAAIVVAVLCLVLTRNTPSGLAASAAMVMFAMFAFGSKAFCNYYYFVIGAICCAMAAFAGPGEDDVIVT